MKTIVAECSLCAATHVRFMAILKLEAAAPDVEARWAEGQRPRFDAHNIAEHEGAAELLVKAGPYG